MILQKIRQTAAPMINRDGQRRGAIGKIIRTAGKSIARQCEHLSGHFIVIRRRQMLFARFDKEAFDLTIVELDDARMGAVGLMKLARLNGLEAVARKQFADELDREHRA